MVQLSVVRFVYLSIFLVVVAAVVFFSPLGDAINWRSTLLGTPSPIGLASRDARPSDPLEAQAFDALNVLRKDANLSLLLWNEDLAKIARERAVKRSKLLSESLDDAGILYYNLSGENVQSFSASNFSQSLSVSLSSENRDRLLRPELDESGLGIFQQGDGTLVLAQVFIHRVYCGFLEAPCCQTGPFQYSCYSNLQCKKGSCVQ
ncbi:MAG: CAP domain-containing protein [Candidatus Diapherotrites archaeon]